jgi:ArsR family transcriptional regulator
MLRTRARDQSQTAQLFHALADETRLQIIECLRDCEQCVCDLTETLKTGQSRLSFHLKILKEAGILIDRREGRWMYYALNPDVLEDVAEAVRALHPSRTAASSKGCCG